VARRKPSRSKGITVQQLNRALERGDIAPVYLVTGDEAFLRRKAIEAIVKAVGGEERDELAIERLDAPVRVPDIVDAARSLPLFLEVAEGPARVVLVSGFDPGDKTDGDLMDAYLDAPVDATCLVIDAPEPAIPGGALNPDLDLHAIESAFHTSEMGFTHFDSLLNDEALAALQRYCLEPSIWFEMKFHSEVGSSLCNGFCCPLLLQIAADIRAAFPSVFGEHLFATCWTYKYFQDESDGHIHADNGAASLNLWVTPDESNLEIDAGGLVLWNKSVPDSYFDASGEEMVEMSQELIAQPDAKPGYVSYGCNRAMMFRSNVLHKTHRLKFKDAYPHRRVSITFLYGKPGQ